MSMLAKLRERIFWFPNAWYGLASLVLVTGVLVLATQLRWPSATAEAERDRDLGHRGANAISTELRALERAIGLFARGESTTLEHLVRRPQSDAVYDELLRKARAAFPMPLRSRWLIRPGAWFAKTSMAWSARCVAPTSRTSPLPHQPGVPASQSAHLPRRRHDSGRDRWRT